MRLVNRAQVVLLMRQWGGATVNELLIQLSPPDLPRSLKESLKQDILTTVKNLEVAGLIAEAADGRFKTTPLLGAVQLALDISLTEIASAGGSPLVVSPVFGRPEKGPPTSEVFVLMPFIDSLRPIYEDHIKLAAKRLDLSVSRADDFFSTEAIVQDIWRAINRAKVIVADCTGRNPNVFYEIGLAHVVGKPTILLTQAMEDVPFDLRHRRCIVYEYTPRGMKVFEDALERSLAAATTRPSPMVEADQWWQV